MSPIHSNSSPHDTEIRRRLSQLQADFNPALQEGGYALTVFYKSYSRFLEEASKDLPEETYQMVYSFVEVVNTISSAILEIDTASEAIHIELEREIEKMARVDFKNLSLHDSPSSGPLPPYIEPCYLWLLAHLHNPYPSKNLRVEMSKETGTPLKDIDAWFIDIRRRIGWNDIRRAHFETRFDMVKAATRHFNPTSRRGRLDPHRAPSVNDLSDYSYHFVSLETRARELYAHKLFPTSLLTDLDRTLKRASAHNQYAYPSPERTPSLGPETPLPQKQRKRRHSDVQAELLFDDEAGRPQRPLKRSRVLATPATCGSPSSTLPSPPQSPPSELLEALSSSVAPVALERQPTPVLVKPSNKRKRRLSDSHEYDSDSSRSRGGQRRRVAEADPQTTTTSQPQKRKRRLSDAQDDRPRKFPHHVALNVPRLQTVSNPLPLPSQFIDPDEIPTSLPAEIPPLSKIVDLDEQNLVIESCDYEGMPAFSEYLSQLETAPSILDNEKESPLVSGDILENQLPQLQTSKPATLFPLLGLDFATGNKLTLPSHDGLFTDVQAALEVWQNYPLISEDNQFSFQTFDPTLAQSASALPMQSSGVNPIDLLLYPSTNIPPAHAAKPSGVAYPLNMSWGPALGNTSQAAYAIQKIQTLQAELEICKSQLAQHSMISF